MLRATEAIWQIPAFTREGQRLFWDRQAVDYDQVSLTGNHAELALVRALCNFFCEAGYRADDVISLGCGVGSRDPEIVLECLSNHSQTASTIYLNDLSERMLARASTFLSGRYSGEYALRPGAAADALRTISPRPRRVILGVYRAEAFARPSTHYGHMLSGFDDYMQNAERLGPYFEIRDLRLQQNEERFLAEMRVTPGSDLTHLRASIDDLSNVAALDVMRIVGWKSHGDVEFFLSHWFTNHGIRRLLAMHLGEKRASNISLVSCGKGFVICIDPPEAPQGIVTMLNNVFGNLVPQDWGDTLQALQQSCQL